eukprot:1160726-Pelagomonas_calceolata.AAC.7
MKCKVTLLFLLGFLELRVLSLVRVLACWAVAASKPGFLLLAGVDQPQADQPNNLAEGLPM